jgi:hypothetical protein
MVVKRALEKLMNIGPKTADRLENVGIDSIKKLKEAGPVDVFCRLKVLYPDSTSNNALYALQAAMLNVDWREIPSQLKTDLQREAYENMRTTKYHFDRPNDRGFSHTKSEDSEKE